MAAHAYMHHPWLVHRCTGMCAGTRSTDGGAASVKSQLIACASGAALDVAVADVDMWMDPEFDDP